MSTLIAKVSLPDLMSGNYIFKYAGDSPSNHERSILKYEEYTVGDLTGPISIYVVIEVLSWSKPDNECIDSELCRASSLCFYN